MRKGQKRGERAKAGNPHSATSQFYINVASNTHLDFSNDGYGYTVFGQVIQGMSIINKIKKVKTRNDQGFANVPFYNIRISKAKVLVEDDKTENNTALSTKKR